MIIEPTTTAGDPVSTPETATTALRTIIQRYDRVLSRMSLAFERSVSGAILFGVFAHWS
ncbi:hypothetical protein ACFQL4_17710 [Halosimplex aquaticum]